MTTTARPGASVPGTTSAGTSGGASIGGSDTGSGEPTARPPSASASAATGSGDNTAFCADAVKAMAIDDKPDNGPPDTRTIKLWDGMTKEAPAAIASSVDNVDRQLHQQADHGTMDDIAGFATAYRSVLQWVGGNCGLTPS
ncbi:hypothetical protein ACFZBU_36225 [Embleya sp. NPDC008237]|uniref:hypothetical protein n=1 Tax=Embleya sp. NPDC008237 TaxID=3363978 RepID=UPI0036F089D8